MNLKLLCKSVLASLVVATAVFAGAEVTSISGTPSNGFLPIGNGTSYTPAALTAGAGISVTNGAGSITLATTGANPIVANARQTGQTAADTTITTYTVGGSDTTFEVECNVNITTSTTYSFTATCAYTDEGNTGRTLTLVFTSAGGVQIDTLTNTNGLGAGAYHGSPQCIRAKAGSSITLATTGTFTSVTYNVEGVIRQVSGTGGIPAATNTTNTQSLSGTLTLSNTSATYQHLNPNGANRTVTLPSSPTTGIWFSILNTASGNTYTLTVNNAASALVATVNPGNWIETIYDGSTWQVFPGSPVVVDDYLWGRTFFTQQSRLPTTMIFNDFYTLHATDFSNMGTGASLTRFESRGRFVTGTAAGSNFGWDLGASYNKVLFLATLRCPATSSLRLFMTNTLPTTANATPKSAYEAKIDITGGSTATRLQKTDATPSETNITGDAQVVPNGLAGPDCCLALYVDGTNHVEQIFIRAGGSSWFPVGDSDSADSALSSFRYVGLSCTNPAASVAAWIICPVVCYAQ